MDWSNEPYVRVYTRETDDDLALSWEAMALWNQLLKRFDRSGFVETRRGARGIAAITRIPLPVVESALPELLEDGRLVAAEGGFIAPNYVAAQEAVKSDKQRQKDSRDRRRAQAMDALPVTNRDGADTNRDRTVTGRDASVTSGHDASRAVTLCSAVSADPTVADQVPPPAGARAIPPSPVPDQGQRKTLRDIAWARLNAKRAEFPGTRPLNLHDPGYTELASRILESGSEAEANVEHVLAIAFADAKVNGPKYLSGSMFEQRNWSKKLSLRVEDVEAAERPRAGPKRAGELIGPAKPQAEYPESPTLIPIRDL